MRRSGCYDVLRALPSRSQFIEGEQLQASPSMRNNKASRTSSAPIGAEECPARM